MRLHPRFSALGVLFASAAPLSADVAPQSQISFTRGAANTWNSDWTGVAKRTYFVQWSLDLVTWSYAPFMEFGAGTKHYSMDVTETGSGLPYSKVFVRLKYVDAPGIENLQQAKDADFDNDGIPNWYEVEQLETDPLNKASAGGDTDGDGLADGWEKFHFGNLATAAPGAILKPDGLTNQEKHDLGMNPNLDYSNPTPSQPINYAYDLVGRLTGVTASVAAATYTPDEEGNIFDAQ